MSSAGRFTSYSTSIEDLKAAEAARSREARDLLEKGHYAAAIMAAYMAVEIALKVYICRHGNQTRLQEPYKRHDLKELLHAAGLYEFATTMKPNPNARVGSAFVSSAHNPVATHVENWNTVLRFTEPRIIALRYENPSSITQADAERYVNAVILGQTSVLQWLQTQP